MTIDGYATVEEYAERAKEINQQYICITDHGMMGIVPRQLRACEKHGLHPLFGCELYVNNKHVDRDLIPSLSEPERRYLRKSHHLLAIAFNDIGYRNLVRLSSWGWIHGYYNGKPRVTHKKLLEHKEGIIFTSCCYNGEIGYAFDNGGAELADQMLEEYMRMFLPNFYLEIMLLDFKKQKPYDAYIVSRSEKYHLPIILTNDNHYCYKEDSKNQRLMLMIQKKTTLADIERKLTLEEKADIFELQDENLWMKSEEELNEKWLEMYSESIPLEIFEKAKMTTVEICRKARGVEINRDSKLPQIPDADFKFKEALFRGYKWRGVSGRDYELRLKEEYELITRKGFSSYFLIQKTLVDEARRVCPEFLGYGTGSEALGPGRGCQSPDTEIVLTSGKNIPIKDVKVGDKVWTRDGSQQEVLQIHCYNCDEKLLKINTYYGDNKGVTLTKDHKVLVEKMRRPDRYEFWAESTKRCYKAIKEPTGNLEWHRSDELSVGDWLFVPKLSCLEKDEIKCYDLAMFCNDKNYWHDDDFVYQGKYKTKKMIRYIKADPNFWTIVGIFAGDGWFSLNGSNLIEFAFHKYDNLIGVELLQSKINEWQVDSLTRIHKEKKLIRIGLKNYYLRKLFEMLFNEYKCTSQTKHVPKVIFDQGQDVKKCFLNGYRMSDGHIGENKITYSTTSEVLASQVKTLFNSLGEPCSKLTSNRFDKRTSKSSIQYNLNVPLLEFLGSAKSQKQYCYRKIENGILIRIRSTEEVDNKAGKVYDLSVANQHNYLTSSFLVHNSAVGSLACYVLGITDVDPIKHGLLFSRFLSEARGGKSLKIKFSKKPLC